ncbi:MAG: dUTP diphosphatase [Candidatus Gracilibacteria bacterium]
MKVKIKRIDSTLPLPEYHTSGAVGFDLIARETVTIPAKGLEFVPNNVIIKIPEGYMLLLANRSSTAKKRGLTIANGIGIIDQDYCGNEDELKTLFYNMTDEPVTVQRGERLSQCVFVRVDQGEWEEVEEMSDPTRGGFGTTDKV